MGILSKAVSRTVLSLLMEWDFEGEALTVVME